MRPRGLHAPLVKGKRYVYHRGPPTRTRLLGIQEVNGRLIATRADLAQIELLNRGVAKPIVGTLGALFDAWMADAAFHRLAPRTRADYEKIVSWLAPAPDPLRTVIDTSNGRDMPLRALTAVIVLKIRNKAHEKHGLRFANYCVSVLGSACAWGIPRGYLAANPTREIKPLQKPMDAKKTNRAATDSERLAIIEDLVANAPQLVLPVAIGMSCAIREGDVLRLQEALAWDGATFRWKASKNAGEGELSPPPRLLLDALTAAAQTRKRSGWTSPSLCLNSRGNPWSSNGFRSTFFKRLKVLETAGLVRPGLTFHGLRHGVGKGLAELGASEETIKAALANNSTASVQVYTRQAERKRLQAAATTLMDGVLASESALLAAANERRRGVEDVLAEMRDRADELRRDAQQKRDAALADRARAARSALVARGASLGLKDTEMARALGLHSSMVGTIRHATGASRRSEAA